MYMFDCLPTREKTATNLTAGSCFLPKRDEGNRVYTVSTGWTAGVEADGRWQSVGKLWVIPCWHGRLIGFEWLALPPHCQRSPRIYDFYEFNFYKTLSFDTIGLSGRFWGPEFSYWEISWIQCRNCNFLAKTRRWLAFSWFAKSYQNYANLIEVLRLALASLSGIE